MSSGYHIEEGLAALDELIEKITVDASGDDEKYWAFREAYEEEVALPADGLAVGEPVSVLEIDYSGNERRGLTAKCRREDGTEHVISALDVVFPENSSAARCTAAYRRWLGLDPYPAGASARSGSRRHKVAEGELDLSVPIVLVALSVKRQAVSCLLPGSNRSITLRAGGLWGVVPGELITVRPRKQWRYAGHPYLSGEIESSRLDAAALGLVPLHLEKRGMWDPADEYRGEEGDPTEDWARPVIERGPRPIFVMEQVIPGWNPDDPEEFEDPITRANDLKGAGWHADADQILMELCKSDLRCLDAHAHLGNSVFDKWPDIAVRHYEVGLRIGELSLGAEFDCVLPWRHINNRPFLRCMHGYGLCLWRLERFDEAELVFERMLMLNPWDNQGARFLIDPVKAETAWEEHQA